MLKHCSNLVGVHDQTIHYPTPFCSPSVLHDRFFTSAIMHIFYICENCPIRTTFCLFPPVHRLIYMSLDAAAHKLAM